MGSGQWWVLLVTVFLCSISLRANAAPPGPFDLLPDTRPTDSPPAVPQSPPSEFIEPTSRPKLVIEPLSRPTNSDAPDGIYWRKNDASSRPAPIIGTPTPFDRKDLEFGVGIQGFSAHHTRDDNIVFGTLDLSYFVARNFSIGLEAGLAPGTSTSPNNTTNNNQTNFTGDNDDDQNFFDLLNNISDGGQTRMRASEAQMLVRYHLFSHNRLSLYLDGCIGYLHATDYFPTNGRSDNWLVSAGMGVDWRIVYGCYFHLGGRFARLSGGDLFAGRNTRNASDGVQYYGGISFEW